MAIHPTKQHQFWSLNVRISSLTKKYAGAPDVAITRFLPRPRRLCLSWASRARNLSLYRALVVPVDSPTMSILMASMGFTAGHPPLPQVSRPRAQNFQYG